MPVQDYLKAVFDPDHSEIVGAHVSKIKKFLAAQGRQILVPASEISPDPRNDPFCLCSEQGEADFIVTLNPKDFSVDRLKAIVVCFDRFPV